MKIECRFTGKVLFEDGSDSMKLTLEAAVSARAYLARAYLAGANLAGANLAGANLDGANLAGANLAGATYGGSVEIGNNPLFITGLRWPVMIFKAHIKIGCRLHAFDEWERFGDDEIAEMDDSALEFWNQWKAHILGVAGNK